MQKHDCPNDKVAWLFLYFASVVMHRSVMALLQDASSYCFAGNRSFANALLERRTDAD